MVQKVYEGCEFKLVLLLLICVFFHSDSFIFFQVLDVRTKIGD